MTERKKEREEEVEGKQSFSSDSEYGDVCVCTVDQGNSSSAKIPVNTILIGQMARFFKPNKILNENFHFEKSSQKMILI